MSERFIKFIPSEEADYLLVNHPNAFFLLTKIAMRARRESGHPDGLLPGQCHIGDWKSYGLTEQQYRTAKKILEQRQHLKIIETCRNRKKSTTGTTTIGTLVELISSTIYDINKNDDNDRFNDRPTTDQRPTNDDQEGIRRNKKDQDDDNQKMDMDKENFENQNVEKLIVAKCKGPSEVVSIFESEFISFCKEKNFSMEEISSAIQKFKEKNPTMKIGTKQNLIKYLLSILENQRSFTCPQKSPKKNSKKSSTCDREICLENGTSEPILERLMRQNGLN